MSEAVTVRTATLVDVPYVDNVRRKNSEAVGFLSSAVYEGVVTGQGPYVRPNNRLWVAEVNGDRVGFLYLTPGHLGGTAKVVQVCVQEDARRHDYAAALVIEAERYAHRMQRSGVSLAVAADLDATRFWDAIGYELRFTYEGGARRGRVLERRYKPLTSGLWLPSEMAA